MKPGKKFRSRVNILKSILKPSSKAEAKVARKSINAKNEHLASAVKWCLEIKYSKVQYYNRRIYEYREAKGKPIYFLSNVE